MGTAHFFEHLVFKGSEIKNRQELEMYAENTSTLMNAYTSREQTCYYFQGRVFTQFSNIVDCTMINSEKAKIKMLLI